MKTITIVLFGLFAASLVAQAGGLGEHVSRMGGKFVDGVKKLGSGTVDVVTSPVELVREEHYCVECVTVHDRHHGEHMHHHGHHMKGEKPWMRVSEGGRFDVVEFDGIEGQAVLDRASNQIYIYDEERDAFVWHASLIDKEKK